MVMLGENDHCHILDVKNEISKILSINGHVLSIKVYEAGKAVKAGVPSQYAASYFAPSVYGQPVYVGGPSPPIPVLPMPQVVGAPPSNGYGRDIDTASSGW